MRIMPSVAALSVSLAILKVLFVYNRQQMFSYAQSQAQSVIFNIFSYILSFFLIFFLIFCFFPQFFFCLAFIFLSNSRNVISRHSARIYLNGLGYFCTPKLNVLELRLATIIFTLQSTIIVLQVAHRIDVTIPPAVISIKSFY